MAKKRLNKKVAIIGSIVLVFFIMGGLGLFFTGVGVLWFVTVYKEKKE